MQQNEIRIKFSSRAGHNTFWIIILLLGTCYLPAQSRSSWNITPVELPDVFSNRSVNDIIQDHAGVVWIANNTGLYLYDGIECKIYNNAFVDPERTGKIYRLIEDGSARLWVLSEKGLVILDKHRKISLAPTELGLSKSVLAAPNLNICKGTGQDIFILSGSKVYIWKNNQLKVWSRYAHPIVRTDQRAIMLYSKKQDQIYWYLPEQNDPVNRLLIYRHDDKVIELWKAQNHIIEKFNPITFKFTLVEAFADSVSIFSSIQPNDVTKVKFSLDFRHLNLQFDKSANISVGVFLNDIYIDYINKFNPSLNINNIGRVFIFKLSEHVYALSSSEGIIITQEKPQPFRYYKNSLGYRVRAIHKDAYGHVIFGSYGGTQYIDQTGNKLHHIESVPTYIWSILKTSPSNDHFVMQGEDDTNIVYFLESSASGVRVARVRTDIGDISQRSYNTCMAKDKVLNGFWHLTNDDYLSFYDLSTDQNHKFSPRIKEREERAMIATKDGIWLAGHRGLRFFSKPNFTDHTYQDRSSEIPDQIRKLSINALYLDRNQNLWIGTNAQGFIQYNTATHRIRRFRTSEGLAENTVFSILTEPDDKVIWIGTGKGLSRFEVNKNWFDNYYTEDGLSNNEFNTAAAHRASDGMMYMGGQNGINYFHPDSFKTQTNALKQFAVVWLKGAGVIDSSIQQMIVSPGTIIRVSPSIKLIEFGFRTNEYFHTAQLQYRYRIPGLISKWAYLNPSDKALLSFLPPGKHILEVQVRSYRGMWLPPVRYYLQVVPPWYKTWWFWAMVSLAVIVLLYQLFRYRIQQLRKEFSLRQQLSHDLHDNLGSRMFLLRSLSHQLTNPLMNDKDKKDLQIRLEEISQDLFKSIRDFIWSFDPTQDEVSNLFQRMDDFAENYISSLVPGGVEVNIAQNALNQKLQPRTKHHVLSVYQELLTNMVKHTHVQKMVINLRIENHLLKVNIQNWHKGLQSKGNIPGEDLKVGLESIQYRLAEIGADLLWQESEAEKQVAEIEIPTH